MFFPVLSVACRQAPTAHLARLRDGCRRFRRQQFGHTGGRLARSSSLHHTNPPVQAKKLEAPPPPRPHLAVALGAGGHVGVLPVRALSAQPLGVGATCEVA